MDQKSEKPKFNPPQSQYGYQQFSGSSSRPYPYNPYYPTGQMWGTPNYFDPNLNSMYGYGNQPKIQTFFSPDSTLHIDNTEYPFKNKFPRLHSYEDENEIRSYFKNTLENVNNPDFDPESAKGGAFFILRSTNDENIHKSIKYGIWTSSAANNETLTQALKACQETNSPVYLIFSVAKSGHFIGVAEMLTEFDAGMSFKYWCEGNKWFGTFKVRWIFVKDVEDSSLMHIKQ